MADVASALKNWSTTPGSNTPIGSTAIGTGLDDNIREIQAVVRDLAAENTIASASTTDLGAVDETFLTVTGTTTITAFGTVSAGIYKWLTFSGALTLTHNATSLILPTASNITTVAGDVALVRSLGSGNWRCLGYQRTSALFPAALVSGKVLTNNGTVLSWGDVAGALSALTAATADNTIANTQYQQAWSWLWSSSGTKIGMTLSGAASAPGFLTILKLAPNGPLVTGLQISSPVYSGDLLNIGGNGTIAIGSNAAQTAAGDAGSVSLKAASANAGAAGAGGSITIQAGNSGASGDSGAVRILAGAGATGNGFSQLADDDGSESVVAEASGLTLNAAAKLVINAKHIYFDNLSGAPTISSGGGSGATIVGSNNCFEVTIGTGSPTSVVVNFGSTWAALPTFASAHCSQNGASLFVTALSTTQITIDSNGTALSSGVKVRVLVFGTQ